MPFQQKRIMGGSRRSCWNSLSAACEAWLHRYVDSLDSMKLTSAELRPPRNHSGSPRQHSPTTSTWGTTPTTRAWTGARTGAFCSPVLVVRSGEACLSKFSVGTSPPTVWCADVRVAVERERSTAVSPAGPRSEGSSRKRSTAVSPFNPRAKGSSRKRSTAVPATEPGSTS